ncbi:MAG TPA: PilZ domain-containing protein [Candidatus Acidoferrum sp.]|nr:PilZ domain-containing protein [Candidatus Acidoferrum sp.]
MASRQHARVRLRLPVRLRWIVPPGQQSEICETRNVSKGGLLVACKEHHNEGFPLWVTFPFDAAAPEQPEVLARVMRSRRAEGNGHEEIALHFESMPIVTKFAPEKTPEKIAVQPAAKPAVLAPLAPEKTKESPAETVVAIPHKNGNVQRVVLPIRVRPEDIPWFEEAMTTEVSAEEIRFLSHREYLEGDTLYVTFVRKDARPWAGNGDFPSKIVKIEIVPKAAALLVTIRRI